MLLDDRLELELAGDEDDEGSGISFSLHGVTDS